MGSTTADWEGVYLNGQIVFGLGAASVDKNCIYRTMANEAWSQNIGPVDDATETTKFMCYFDPSNRRFYIWREFLELEALDNGFYKGAELRMKMQRPDLKLYQSAVELQMASSLSMGIGIGMLSTFLF